jgi:hypothetical protein
MIDTLLSNQWLVSNIVATVMVIVAMIVTIGVVKWFAEVSEPGTLLGLLLRVSCFTIVAWCAIYMTKSFHNW